jgi:hypothetical protein
LRRTSGAERDAVRAAQKVVESGHDTTAARLPEGARPDEGGD